ncbi:MAG: hypothetical protein ABR910_14095 [Acidobacteriaceae bacterium]
MRTLLQLAVVLVFFAGGVGAAFAANSGVAPVLVPYWVNGLAGNEQPSNSPTNTSLPSAGYGGDNGPAIATATNAATATLNSPNALGVDAAGNIYFADTSSAIIREINAQTGVIKTIAGVPPSNCSGYESTSCSKTVIGCSEAVPALNDPIGGNIKGLAVDENDNVYFSDSSQFTISVIYHGGARVAAFIQLVDPAGVAAVLKANPTATSGVLPGYVYHVAGTVNLTSCVGTKGTTAAVDNVIAYQSGALANTSGQLFLDSAGNIYIQDVGNNVVRVINTQTTPQTFFQYVVQPGFIRSIVDCSGAFTVLCPTVVTPTAGTGLTFAANTPQNPSSVVDGPANALTYNTQTGMGVDAYGNVYQVDNKNATPGIYLGVSMAGGAPLAKYLSYIWKGVNIAYGDSYEAVNDISLNTSLAHYYDNILVTSQGAAGGDAIVRPTAVTADPLGNIWALDNHFPSVYRIDVNSAILLDVDGYGGGNAVPDDITSGKNLGNSGTYSSWAVQNSCITSLSGQPNFVGGPTAYDGRLDGCPAKVSSTSANGELVSDGYGNIYNADTSFNEIRVFQLDNVFPATAVGAKVTQPIDVHFDASNQPTVLGVATSAFSFTPGISDFSIDTTDPNFQALLWVHAAYAINGTQNSTTANTIALYAGLPSCIQNAAAVGDASWDCLVYVTFDPTAPGLRETQLVATTANGSVYYFPLIGTGTGGQLSIDGGQQATIPATGLGTTPAVAVASTGNIYIADPANNRIAVCTQGSGSLCKTQANLPLVFPSYVPSSATTLSGPMGVAVDAGGNIYISDTGNNRILEVNPVTNAVTILGGIAWVSCTAVANPTASPAIVGKPCPLIAPGAAAVQGSSTTPGAPASNGPIPVYNPLQQYLFKGPQGLAVDLNGNVFVADTGNSAIVEIPNNPVLGGAFPLFQYTGAPTFVTPVGVAVDPKGNVYVADTGNPFQQVVKIPPGGGDLQNLIPLGSSLPTVGGQGITTPSGVTVDGAGDVFISDSGANVIWEAPAAGAPNGNPFTLSFSGLTSPAGLAIDSGGNLYVANSGSDQILYMNRQNPVGNFGAVPEDLGASGLPSTPVGCLQNGSSTICSGVLTVTNSGNTPLTLAEPVATITSGPPSFAVSSSCGGTLNPGATCTISPTYQPTSSGAQSATLTVNGTQTVALVANGGQPQAKMVLTASYSGGTPAAGGTATYTATMTQPHVPPGGTPTGTVTFVITVDNALYVTGSCGTNSTVTVPLVAGVASTSITEAQGRIYSVVATYNGDTNDSPIDSNPLITTVPGIPVTATAASLSFTYGVKPAAITGTITGVDSSVTATLVSGASQYSPVSGSPYPVTVAFTGGDYCAYGNPPVYNPGTTTQAVVTESPAQLTDTLPAFSAVYGAPDLNYALQLVFVGAVNGDQNKITASFTPAHSSVLSIAGSPYTVVPTFSGKPISLYDDYTVKYSNGSLTISQAPSAIAATLAASAELPANVAKATIALAVSTAVAGGIGVPTGTVTVSDTITTITTGAPGLGTVIPPCTGTLTPPACNTPVVVTLVNGSGTFTPSNAEGVNFNLIGLHQFSYTYSGDANFQGSTLNPPPVTPATPACAPAALIASCLLVDDADFTMTSATGIVPVVPGVTPSGNGLLAAPGQNSTYPESAAISVVGLLSETGTISLQCLPLGNPYSSPVVLPPANAGTASSYIQCSMTPPAVTLAASGSSPTTGTSTTVISIFTPVTEPIGYQYFSKVRMPGSETLLAFLPFGVLAFCLRRRRRLSKVLWMLLAIAIVTAGMSGCGGNQVDFYSPIPEGPQYIQVTATGNTVTSGVTNPTFTRTFLIEIYID